MSGSGSDGAQGAAGETPATWGVAVLSKEGDALAIDAQEEIAPGVLGYAMVVDGALYIPWVEARKEGSGDVGRFLDQLPRDKTIKFPTIISHRLLGMLRRRGYVSSHETNRENGEVVDVMVRHGERPRVIVVDEPPMTRRNVMMAAALSVATLGNVPHLLIADPAPKAPPLLAAPSHNRTKENARRLASAARAAASAPSENS